MPIDYSRKFEWPKQTRSFIDRNSPDTWEFPFRAGDWLETLTLVKFIVIGT